ncbi:hypothetical protein [Vacuolonema iberomarrocanum]|uniref:hypothetical protein n=1 Tax=Vacuolonema iberomarrocanum TaxID=3454632 RepID=UPI003F6DC2E3
MQSTSSHLPKTVRAATCKSNGVAMRTLHEFLKRKDPDKVWGGLTRTVTPEGDVLWLCKEHIKELYPTSS